MLSVKNQPLCNYEKLKLDILKLLRGDLNYTEMSTFLGYKFNQYYKYESGDKRFFLADFINICKVTNVIDIEQVFKESLDISIDGKEVKGIVREFCRIWGRPNQFIIEEHLKISQSKWWRIYNGKSDITLVEFLILIESLTPRLEFFLGQILTTDLGYEIGENEKIFRDLLFENPDVSRVLAGIRLDSYKKADPVTRLKVLSKKTRISEHRLEKLINTMLKEDIIFYQNGLLKEKYEKAFKDRNFDQLLQIRLYKYFNNVALEKNLFSENKCCPFIESRVLAVTNDAREKILMENRKFQRKINEIIKEQNSEEDLKHIIYTNRAVLDI